MMTNNTLIELENTITQCRACPRLVEWRERVGEIKRKAYRDQEYWAKPVPGFGDPAARILVVGLAPGAHGSNRTGRMFTGDDSGNFLYAALYRSGFANRPEAINRNDGLTLKDIFITAVCRCVPPDNRPTPGEMRECQPFLEGELACFPHLIGVVALGKIAYEAIFRILYSGKKGRTPAAFGHGAFVEAANGKPWILGSYHTSRQNTQTGRLTTQMFDEIWRKAARILQNSTCVPGTKPD